VTERKRAEQALRESQERLTLALAAARIGEWSLDLTTGEATHSALYDRIFGYEEPLPGWTYEAFLDHVHPDDRAFVTEAFERSKRTGDEWEFECRITRADGEVRWVWALGSAQGAVASGEGGRMYGLVNDATERRQSKEALRRAAERDAFRVKLADVLRPLSDAAAIQGATARLLREHFGAGWSYYVEFDQPNTTITVLSDAKREGLPSMVGQHDFSDMPEFLTLWRSGQLVRVADFRASVLLSDQAKARYLASGISAFLGAPVLKDGVLLAALILADTEAQAWSDTAVYLTTERAELAWATVERARTEAALRDLNHTLERRVEERTEQLTNSEQRFSKRSTATPSRPA
jgi:PAS domain S-box-containing protein